MKKDPNLIFLILAETLNKLKFEKKYNINNIRKITQLHWNTIHKYIKIIKFIQDFVPPIDINMKNNKIEYFEVRGFSKFINENYQVFEKLILFLMINNAFNEENSIKYKTIKEFKCSKKDIKSLSESGLIKIKDNETIYLTNLGIRIGSKMFINIDEQLSEFLKSEDDKSKPSNIVNYDDIKKVKPLLARVDESKLELERHPIYEMLLSK